MRATPRDIEVYVSRHGHAPFDEWLDSLRDRKLRNLVMTRVQRFELGNAGDSRSVGEGVMELRIDYGPGIRVYYGDQGQHTVLLLTGGTKDTQQRDIR